MPLGIVVSMNPVLLCNAFSARNGFVMAEATPLEGKCAQADGTESLKRLGLP